MVPCKFLDRTVHRGVSRKMRVALAKTEEVLRKQYVESGSTLKFKVWCGDNGITGWREGKDKHNDGIAIDFYTDNPYIVTRTGTSIGGEYAGRKLKVMRYAFLAVCDRAVGGTADLSHRKYDPATKKKESTGAIWDRFNAVSEALKRYFAPYFRVEKNLIHRYPVADYVNAPREAFAVLDGELLSGVALADVPLQVLRDYEAVRIPMVFGSVTTRPEKTRNPARGFLTIPRHVVVALCDVGNMRWGMCDFSVEEDGDGMHFDLR